MRTFIALVISVAAACGGKIEETTPTPSPSPSSSDGTVRACGVMYLACSNGDACTQSTTCGTQTCRCENDRWTCDDPCTPPPDCPTGGALPDWSCPLYGMHCPLPKACHSKTPECVCGIHNHWSCPADLFCDPH